MVIKNFNLVTQKQTNTCGYATAAMIFSYLEGSKIEEGFLLENEPFDGGGISIMKLMDVYKKYLQEYVPEIVYDSKENMEQLIKTNLDKGLPLHILYYTENAISFRNDSLPDIVKQNYPSNMMIQFVKKN